MSPDQLRWRPPGWHSSAWDLALHLCEAEWGWVSCNVFREASWGDWDDSELGDLETLLARWDAVHARTRAWIEETSLEGLLRELELPFDDFPRAPMAGVLHHLIEHKAHHRGQIFMLLRRQGLTPPET